MDTMNYAELRAEYMRLRALEIHGHLAGCVVAHTSGACSCGWGSSGFILEPLDPDAPTAEPDAPTAEPDASSPIPDGTLTVRKLRRILDGLAPGMPIVLDGTEWTLPAGDARLVHWFETEQSGRETGRSADVLKIDLHGSF
jgi:hypothetical protein